MSAPQWLQDATARILDEMHEKGYLEYFDDSKEIFRLTPKGEKYVKERLKNVH